MGRPPGWAAAITGRSVMRSPGRPPARRDLERAFWVQIAAGLTSEDAAVACGVSGPVGSRWFRHAGEMPPIELAPVAVRYLSFVERVGRSFDEHTAARWPYRQKFRSSATAASGLCRFGVPSPYCAVNRHAPRLCCRVIQAKGQLALKRLKICLSVRRGDEPQ
jgi:hypothetical protein